MALQGSAPKQWALTKKETVTSFESWKGNIMYHLTLNPNFTTFLQQDSKWEKSGVANRGLVNDADPIPENKRKTAEGKVIHLELMLGQIGQIANFCPVLS